MRPWATALVCQLILTATPALGNGIFVANTHATSIGGLVPLETVKIRLRSETLHITVGAPPDYTARAVYELDNPGPAATLLYGVPMVMDGTIKPEQQARRIRIQVAGRRYRCRAEEHKAEKLLERLVGRHTPMETGPSWCVATVTVPSGSVKLDLRYSGSLLYSDFVGPGCAWLDVRRHLVYPLWPAGYLAGKAERVDATVDLGPMGDYVRTASIEPPGFKREEGVVRWSWQQVDLKQLKQIRLTYDLDALSQGAQMTGFNRTAVRATASSPAAQRLLDGRRFTAWCPAQGVGAWVEQRLTAHPRSYVYEYAIAGGAAMNSARRGKKVGRFLHDHPSERWIDLNPAFVVAHGSDPDARAFAADHRVRRLRVSLCREKSSRASSDYTLPQVKLPEHAVHELRLSGALLAGYQVDLDRWSARLRQAALPCLELCRARRIRRCPQGRPSPKFGDNLCGQVGCEIKCMEAAAGRLKLERNLHPCLRFTILELDHGQGPEPRTCIRELAPSFNSCF